MPLITKEIRLKSQTCRDMVNVIMDTLEGQRQKKNMMYKQLEFVARGLCMMVPYQGHFRKMYGMSPYRYTWRETEK
jgi:hypothetical protein